VCIEYALSSDSSIISILDRITEQLVHSGVYTKYPWSYMTWDAFIHPDIMHRLAKEMFLDSFSSKRFDTPYGSLHITVVPDIELPIFVGTFQELKNNSFNLLLEDVFMSKNE